MRSTTTTTEPVAAGERDPVEVRQVVTAEGIAAYHVAFGGSNSIHTDPETARHAQLGDVVQHGMRTLYPIMVALLDMCADGDGPAQLSLDAKFVAAARPGDVLSASVRGRASGEAGEAGVQDLQISAKNQNNADVLVGSAKIRRS